MLILNHELETGNKSWGIVLDVLAVSVYRMDYPMMGGLQSLVLGTGVITPDIAAAPPVSGFDYHSLFTDLNGEKIDLKEYKRKTLFIVLWPPGAHPAGLMPPICGALQKSKGGRKLEFLMIALDEDFEKSKKFIRITNSPFPVFHVGHG